MTTGTASVSDTGGAFVAPVHPGELVAGKYRVEQTLGVGGMGVVIAARDEVLERRVAIKFLLPRLAGSETAAQRFVREARSATRITSEHVVRLLEIDKLTNGTPFFVMEYLEGRDLRAVLREDGPLAPSLAVDYLLQALQAVAEGHIKGIVHRDIKPGNLFLTTRADGTSLIKVLDFGIAKRLEREGSLDESSLTSSDDVRLGSPAYMPPEQLQDPRDVDTRSDIWSIGATLYELVSGKPPFEGPGYLELVSRILTSPPKPLSTPRPAQALEAVVRKCLEKDRTLRYANAMELAAALAPLGSDDARVSLTRVTGMHASSPNSVRTSRVVVEPAGSSTTTLPVAGESYSSREVTTASPSTGSSGGRSWLVVGATVAVGMLALVFRNVVVPTSVQAAAPRAVDVADASQVAKVRAPVVAQAPVVAAAPAALQQVTATQLDSPTKPVTPTPSHAPVAVAMKASSSKTTAVRAAPAGSRPEPLPAAVEAPILPVVQFPASSAVESKAGRSQEIERLIEKRR